MPSPEQLQALSNLGFLGGVLLLIGLIIRRVLITKAEKDDADGIADSRLSEMRTDRDAWKTLALQSVDERHEDLGKITDLTRALEVAIAKLSR